MYEDELHALLIELCATIGAADACIVRPDEPLGELDGRSVPLGGGAYLCVHTVGAVPLTEAQAAAVERTARALRACARRWERELPELGGEPEQPMRERIVGRIETYLRALATSGGATNALVTVRGRLIGAAKPAADLELSRIEFLLRRMDAEVGRRVGESSHAELEGDDFYAVSFWYGACLVVFFDQAYSVNFVRHRARMVTRELAALLPELDEPPHDPARVAPIPE